MIYLRQRGQYVGPFKGRRDAERFIGMMKLCGEDWTDTEVIEDDRLIPMRADRTYPISRHSS
jgi:hypothetical protein